MTRYNAIIARLPKTLPAIAAAAIATGGIIACLNAEWNAAIILGMLITFTYLATARPIREITHLQRVTTIIFSTYTAINLVLHTRITYSGNVTASLTDNHFNAIGPQHVLLAILLSAVFYILVNGLAARLSQCHGALSNFLFRINANIDDVSTKHRTSLFLPVFIIIAICWLPIWLALYPGAGMNDAIYTIATPIKLSSQHPILYVLTLSGFTRVGKLLFGDMNVGIAAYTAVQSLAMAAAIAYVISWFHRKGLKAAPAYILTAFFALDPIFPVFALNTIKDVWFSTAMLVNVPLLLELVETKGAALKGRGLLKYMVAFTALVLSRNNGIYVVVAFGLAALAIVNRKHWKRWAAALIIPLILFLTTSTVPTAVLHAPKVGPQESLGIPLQQTAAVIAQNGRITDSQCEFLSNLLPINQWKSNYAPMSSDPIKWNHDFNHEYLAEHEGEYLKTWAQMLPGNLGVYITSYLTATYGFWSIGSQSTVALPYTNFERIPTGNTTLAKLLGIRQTPLLPQPAADFIRDTWIGPAHRRQAPGAASEIWIMLLLALMLLRLGESGRIFALLPAIACWITLLIAVPIAFSYRYVFYFAMILPFAILTPFMGTHENNSPLNIEDQRHQ